MKKIYFFLITSIATLGCTNAQNKEFSKESLSIKLIALDKSEISFERILKNGGEEFFQSKYKLLNRQMYFKP